METKNIVLDIDNLHLVLEAPHHLDGLSGMARVPVHVQRNGVQEQDHVVILEWIWNKPEQCDLRVMIDPTAGGAWGINVVRSCAGWKQWLPHLVAWAIQHRNVWEDRERLRAEFARERKEVAQRIKAGEYWYWQGDGSDFPESLTCPVIIQPAALRHLLERAGLLGDQKIRVAVPESNLKIRIGPNCSRTMNYTTEALLQATPLCHRVPIIDDLNRVVAKEAIPVDAVLGYVYNPEFRQDGIYAEVSMRSGVPRPKELRWAVELQAWQGESETWQITKVKSVDYFAPLVTPIAPKS